MRSKGRAIYDRTICIVVCKAGDVILLGSHNEMVLHLMMLKPGNVTATWVLIGDSETAGRMMQFS